MKYAFLNTLLLQRSTRLPINRLRALSESSSKVEILEAMAEFGITDTSLALPEANLTLSSAFRQEAEKLGNLVKNSSFLHLLSRRFEIWEAIDFATNFNELKISKKLITGRNSSDLDRSIDLNSFLTKINTSFGFNINQNSRIGEIRDQLLEQYLLKLSRVSSGEAKALILREKMLIELPHRRDFAHFLDSNKGSWFYGVLKGDPNLVDLRSIFYLYRRAHALSVRRPLGEMVMAYYLYNMDLNYKFMKALYFSIKKGVKLDFEQVWET